MPEMNQICVCVGDDGCVVLTQTNLADDDVASAIYLHPDQIPVLCVWLDEAASKARIGGGSG